MILCKWTLSGKEKPKYSLKDTQADEHRAKMGKHDTEEGGVGLRRCAGCPHRKGGERGAGSSGGEEDVSVSWGHRDPSSLRA